MKFQIFTVSACDPDAGQGALNAFLAKHRIVAVDKSFVADGRQSFWCFCVTYLSASQPPTDRRVKVDYREVLSPERFAVFVKLRELRKTLAKGDGIPAYAVFTNEQLAAMTEWASPSLSKLLAIPGIGKARIEKYGKAVVALLSSERNSETSQKVVPS